MAPYKQAVGSMENGGCGDGSDCSHLQHFYTFPTAGSFLEERWFEKSCPEDGPRRRWRVGARQWARVNAAIKKRVNWVQGELSVLAAVYACVAGHLQKYNLSSFYGWEISKTKIPRVTCRPQAEQVWGQLHPGLSHGAVLLVLTDPTAALSLPS